MRTLNPVGRIPSLVLDDGEVLIDSAAILDWLDQTVGPERALIPPTGVGRRHALKLIALATGAIDKIGAATYERLIRPAALRWPDWISRCLTQGTGAIASLAAERWPASAKTGPGPDHDGLHAPLRPAGGFFPVAGRPLPDPRRACHPLRSPPRLPGHLACRVRRSQEPVAATSLTSA